MSTPRKRKKPERKKPEASVRKARQARLPGTDDGAIREIEDRAHDYVEARDARIEAGKEEERRHQLLLAAMKTRGRKTYRHNTGVGLIEIEVTVRVPEERAKVRIKPADGPDEAPAAEVLGAADEPPF